MQGFNTTLDLMKFFGLDWDVNSDFKEFMLFWGSLTIRERWYYQTVQL